MLMIAADSWAPFVTDSKSECQAKKTQLMPSKTIIYIYIYIYIYALAL